MPAPALHNLPPSVVAITPAAVVAGGSVRVLRPVVVMGPSYPATAPDGRGDEMIATLIAPIRERFLGLHGDAPPADVLLLVYRQAWMHFRSPRRKRYNPNLRAETWALVEVRRCCECWAGQRPDACGTWQQHKNIAEFPKRRLILRLNGTPIAPPPDPVPTVAPTPPAPPTPKKPHWRTLRRMAEEAAAKAAPPPPRLSPSEKARRRMEAIQEAGGTSKVSA